MSLPLTAIRSGCLALALLCPPPQAAAQMPEIAGEWVINEDLSDNTDRQVEASLRAAGQRVQRSLFDRREDRYRGGPEEQELYDRISYDDVLSIELEGDEYTFTYADGWSRPVYTDNRRRSVSLSNIGQVDDFSFGHWENDRLMVEARPRDGGFTEETYSLTAEGRLRAEFYIQPRSFLEPITLTRIYDRKAPPP